MVSPSVARREQFVQEFAEPGLEHVHLGIGDWHVFGSIVGHGPLALVGLTVSAGLAASGRGGVVVEVIDRRAVSPQFLGTRHGASVAGTVDPQNGRSPRRATLRLRSPLALRRERYRSRQAMIAWRSKAGPRDAGPAALAQATRTDWARLDARGVNNPTRSSHYKRSQARVREHTSRLAFDLFDLFRRSTGPHIAAFILRSIGRWSHSRRSRPNFRQNAIRQKQHQASRE